MKIGSGTITGRIASPDTGRVKEYELTLKDISTEAETAGGEVKGRISSPDTGRVGDYTFTLDEVIAEGDLTNGTVKGRIASPDTGNVGTYKLQLKDFQIEGGGGSTDEAGVTFIDYDGTEVARYSKAKFLALNEMPANPTHEGLISQGWNWTLEGAKAYLEKYDADVTIGQMYVTDDGHTRLHFFLEESLKSLYLAIAVNGTVEIDWGDGSEKTTLTGTSDSTSLEAHHEYATAYHSIVHIYAIDGYFVLNGAPSSNGKTYKTIRYAEIGSNAVIGISAFSGCYALEAITIPESVTSIGGSAFSACYALEAITIPESVTSIRNYTFSGCYVLEAITIPESVTSIGDSAFNDCYVLEAITIPESVTSIGDGAFSSCFALRNVVIPESVTSIGSYNFSSCYGLRNVVIPESVTSIRGSAFSACYGLRNVVIPESVTSIGTSVFNNCCTLRNVVIPESVTSIGTSAFKGCVSILEVRVLREIPPTLGSSAFSTTSDALKIRVPSSAVSAYKTATGWKSYASKIVGE